MACFYYSIIKDVASLYNLFHLFLKIQYQSFVGHKK